MLGYLDYGLQPALDTNGHLIMSDKPRRPATRLVEAGRRKEWTGAVVNPPVWRASTHLYETARDSPRAAPNRGRPVSIYGRRGAPTQWALADALTELEPGAAGTVLYPSGVAAIAGVLLAVLEPGRRGADDRQRL